MKIELEEKDIERIAGEVVKMIKPLLSTKSNDKDTIFDKKELAKYLAVDVSWLDKKVSFNKIPYFKAGKYVRFKKSAIDKWIESQTVSPISPLKMIKSNR